MIADLSDKISAAASRWRVGRFSLTLDNWLTNLAESARGRKQLIAIAVDSLLVMISLWLAYSVRHGQLFTDFYHTWYVFLILPVLTTAVFAGLGVYRWVVRTTNERLFRQLFKGAVFSGIILLMVFFLLPPDRINPRSLFVIYAALLLLGTCGVRLLWQSLFGSRGLGDPVAIYGSGAAGQQLVNLLATAHEYAPVVFIDDDPRKAGATISGLPVIHSHNGSEQLQAELVRREVSRIVLAIPSLSHGAYQQKLRELQHLSVPILTMPTILELMSGKASIDEIRDVSVTDILGRTEVVPDRQMMGKHVAGKVVLVSGGGGSIGSELCRQIMALSPDKLIVVDNGEANLFHVTEDLKALNAACIDGKQVECIPLLGSVLDSLHMRQILQEHRVNTVFHAAAYKHVPIVEAQPQKGLEVNVFGTLNLLDGCIAEGVEDFVLISTDKAVRPTNAMGASKRVAELVLQAKAAETQDIRISMVRFGNVLGSSGSVVPKFKAQIDAGGPVTLTSAEMTRYFMTIPEAAQLVLQASAFATGGDVFVLDMGEPVRIGDLATTMVKLSGKKLHSETGNPNDIEIVEVGLRPGEKMYEELFIGNNHARTANPRIFSAHEFWLPWSELLPLLQKLRKAADLRQSDNVRAQLLSLATLSESAPVKDYRPGNATAHTAKAEQLALESYDAR